MKVEETDYFGKNNVPAALNFPNVTSAILNLILQTAVANSEPLTVGENEFVVVRVVDHKDEGLQSLDEAKSTIEQFLKREKTDKVLAEKAEQTVKALSADPSKLPSGIGFSEPQTFTLVDNKDQCFMKVYSLLLNHKMVKRLIKLLVTAKVIWLWLLLNV